MIAAKAPWRPTGDRKALRARARLLAAIRRFFAEREVLEVETPILSAAATTAPHLHSFAARYQGPQAPPEGQRFFLHTSPEHAMKRLLAAGSGPIYQMARVFRNGEAGRLHNPEFTMLEWYRPGWDHWALMEEVDELLSLLLATPPGKRLSYREVFRRYLGVDIVAARTQTLSRLASGYGLEAAPADNELSRQTYLDFLMATVIEPQLGRDRPCLIYDYPAGEAQLARIRPPADTASVPVAERFEVYVGGLELANGYHELTDAAEQRQRFERDLVYRKDTGKPPVPIDEYLLAALDHGLPPCAGVALGVDRLLMVSLGKRHIADVLNFPFGRI